MQAREIRDLASEWDADYKRYLASFKADAEKTIKMWNDRMAGGDKEPLWVPLLICAVAARMTWMHVHCPGCNTIAAVDLTMICRPPSTALTSIAEKLECERVTGRQRRRELSDYPQPTRHPMINRPSVLSAKDFDVMIRLAERELATRRVIVETESRPDGSAYRRRKAAKEIKLYEAHIEDLKQRGQKHV